MENFKGTKGKWEKVVTKNGHICVRAKQLYPNRKDLFELNVVVGRIDYKDDCSVPTCCNTIEHANALLMAHSYEMLDMLIDILEQENISQSAHDEINKLIKSATEL